LSKNTDTNWPIIWFCKSHFYGSVMELDVSPHVKLILQKNEETGKQEIVQLEYQDVQLSV